MQKLIQDCQLAIGLKDYWRGIDQNFLINQLLKKVPVK